MIVATDICESVAQTFIKKGLNNTGMSSVTFANLLEFMSRSASSCFVWAGVLIFIINFFIWITVLSRVDLSVAFPVGSTSYIFVPILAMIFLYEAINPVRWVGILLIIAGIHFTARSSHVKEIAQEL